MMPEASKSLNDTSLGEILRIGPIICQYNIIHYSDWVMLVIVNHTVLVVQIKNLHVRISSHLQAEEPPSSNFGEEGAWDSP